MTSHQSPSQLPRSPPSNDGSSTTVPSSVFFASQTYLQENQIKETAKKIREALPPTDRQSGYVYVAKEAGTGYCKVGFAGRDAAGRIEAIEKCQIVTDSSYEIGPFRGARRAESLVHYLLTHCTHIRKQCKCCHKNREWYELDYLEVYRQVQTVYSWLRQKPYDFGCR